MNDWHGMKIHEDRRVPRREIRVISGGSTGRILFGGRTRKHYRLTMAQHALLCNAGALLLILLLLAAGGWLLLGRTG